LQVLDTFTTDGMSSGGGEGEESALGLLESCQRGFETTGWSSKFDTLLTASLDVLSVSSIMPAIARKEKGLPPISLRQVVEDEK